MNSVLDSIPATQFRPTAPANSIALITSLLAGSPAGISALNASAVVAFGPSNVNYRNRRADRVCCVQVSSTHAQALRSLRVTFTVDLAPASSHSRVEKRASIVSKLISNGRRTVAWIVRLGVRCRLRISRGRLTSPPRWHLAKRSSCLLRKQIDRLVVL